MVVGELVGINNTWVRRKDASGATYKIVDITELSLWKADYIKIVVSGTNTANYAFVLVVFSKTGSELTVKAIRLGGNGYTSDLLEIIKRNNVLYIKAVKDNNMYISECLYNIQRELTDISDGEIIPIS
nr:MAG TPA: hypothetical protein [Caudoviricetes sp.]